MISRPAAIWSRNACGVLVMARTTGAASMATAPDDSKNARLLAMRVRAFSGLKCGRVLHGMTDLVRGDDDGGQGFAVEVLRHQPDGLLHRIVVIAELRLLDLDVRRASCRRADGAPTRRQCRGMSVRGALCRRMTLCTHICGRKARARKIRRMGMPSVMPGK